MVTRTERVIRYKVGYDARINLERRGGGGFCVVRGRLYHTGLTHEGRSLVCRVRNEDARKQKAEVRSAMRLNLKH